jgi:hypothetical protein
LTAYTDFPVRVNDEDEDQQSAGVRYQQVQIWRLSAERDRQSRGVRFFNSIGTGIRRDCRKVVAVVRNAENGCYVMQCLLLNPVAVERTVQLNGMDFNPQMPINKEWE